MLRIKRSISPRTRSVCGGNHKAIEKIRIADLLAHPALPGRNSIVLQRQQPLRRCRRPLAGLAALFKPAMHGGILQSIFAAGGLPHQRWHALTQGLQGPLYLSGIHGVAGLVAVEAQGFGIVWPVALALFEHAPQHGLLGGLEPQIIGLHLRFILRSLLLRRVQQGWLEASREDSKGAEHLAQCSHEELRTVTKHLEGLVQQGLVHRYQFRPLLLDQRSHVGDEVRSERGQALDLRPVERCASGVDQAQQLVAVRARHHQHQMDLTGPVQLVTRRLECRHGGFAGLAGEGVLGFVDDQRHRLTRTFVQQAQCFFLQRFLRSLGHHRCGFGPAHQIHYQRNDGNEQRRPAKEAMLLYQEDEHQREEREQQIEMRRLHGVNLPVRKPNKQERREIEAFKQTWE